MSHHISDAMFWGGHPDRNYYVFVALSILFGFFGWDHFYLRSYATGTQKFLFNMVSLGMWHWWDISQIVGNGEKIRKEGLTGPFDWMQGIGRGTFTESNSRGEVFVAPKSYILYTFLAVFFGWLGMDKFYLGCWGQGLLKLISCFNLFLLLFGWLWVLWDAFHAFFMTDSILRDGISPPIPYSMLFTDPISADIFRTQNAADLQPPKMFSDWDWTQKNLGIPPQGGLSFGTVMTNVVNTANTAHANITQHATKVATAANAAVVAAVNAVNAPTAATPTAAPAVEAPNTTPSAAPTALPTTAPTAAPAAPTAHPQSGGGASSTGPGPVIAGTLSALILAGGLKAFYDVISKQYG